MKFIGKIFWVCQHELRRTQQSDFYSSRVHEKKPIEIDCFPMYFIIPKLFPHMLPIVVETPGVMSNPSRLGLGMVSCCCIVMRTPSVPAAGSKLLSNPTGRLKINLKKRPLQ